MHNASADTGQSCDVLKAEWGAWDAALLPKHGPWWYSAASAGVSQHEWRPKGGVYLCPGEPSDVFAERVRALKSWLVQRPEVPCLTLSSSCPVSSFCVCRFAEPHRAVQPLGCSARAYREDV
jgi:hypothetical protein